MDITLNVSLAEVLAEVARKTAYRGAKTEDNPKAQDAAAMERIATIDEDEEELRSFFTECRVELARAFAGRLLGEGLDATEGTYSLSLKVYDGWNTALLPALEYSLKLYFVEGLLARWYMYTDEASAAVHGQLADRQLTEMQNATAERVFERKPWPGW